MADPHKPLSILALAGIAVGFLATLYWTFLFFTLGPEPLPVEQSQRTQSAPRPVNIEQVLAMNLFGKPTARTAPKTESLSDTRLSLVLAGVFVADEASASTALISQKQRDIRRYRVGDRLPGNARLEEVHRDRVVISRGGVREQLRFERGGQMIQPGTNTGQARASLEAAKAEMRRDLETRRDLRRPIDRALAEHREEIDRDPRKFIEDMGLRASEQGGYMLGTFADNDAGLQPGDRLLSVNGRPVGNPEEDRQQLESMLAGNAVDIQIQRGEQLISFTLSLESLN